MKEDKQFAETNAIYKGKNRMPNQTTGTSTEKHSEG